MAQTIAPGGTHCILELHGCPPELLNDQNFVRRALADAAIQGRTALLETVSHRFDPQGVTALGLLAESHISIHTWPENGYAAVDVFTCGQTAEPRVACDVLIGHLGAQRHELRVLHRGGVKIETVGERRGGPPSGSAAPAGEPGDDPGAGSGRAGLCQAPT